MDSKVSIFMLTQKRAQKEDGRKKFRKLEYELYIAYNVRDSQ